MKIDTACPSCNLDILISKGLFYERCPCCGYKFADGNVRSVQYVSTEVLNELTVNGELDMKEDAVNRPSHYTSGSIETIEAIEDWGLGFCLGNAIKYVSRAGKKDPKKTVEDLEKAIWYIKREIKSLEKPKQ